ncbi:MAG TPA: hypothetical protein VG605_07160, partial [Puia sp.]|nr:hypothetical protein [Puia sp.]
MRRKYAFLILTTLLLLCLLAGAAAQVGDRSGPRMALMELIDSAWTHGLDSGRYAQGQRDLQDEKPWIDVAFTFLRDLRSGSGIPELVNYDGLSPDFVKKEDEELMTRLAKIHTAVELKMLAASFVPRSAIYDTLRAALVGVSCDPNKARQLAAALNLYRWIHHFHWRRCIVVNIATARLSYFEQDTMRLQMRIVAGEPSKRTPRLAAWCDQVILYPYWNIPRKIAVNEFLPLFKVSYRLAGTMNIQLFDRNGKVVKEILHTTECPILLVPEKIEMPGSIILAYDGSAASVHAIREFSHLFPEFSGLPATLVYLGGSKDATFPDRENIEELVSCYFTEVRLLQLHMDHKDFFSRWLPAQERSWLVTGSYGRSDLSLLFSKSF